MADIKQSDFEPIEPNEVDPIEPSPLTMDGQIDKGLTTTEGYTPRKTITLFGRPNFLDTSPPDAAPTASDT